MPQITRLDTVDAHIIEGLPRFSDTLLILSWAYDNTHIYSMRPY